MNAFDLVGSSFLQLLARRFLKVALEADFAEDSSECANLSEPVLFSIEWAFLSNQLKS